VLPPFFPALPHRPSYFCSQVSRSFRDFYSHSSICNFYHLLLVPRAIVATGSLITSATMASSAASTPFQPLTPTSRPLTRRPSDPPRSATLPTSPNSPTYSPAEATRITLENNLLRAQNELLLQQLAESGEELTLSSSSVSRAPSRVSYGSAPISRPGSRFSSETAVSPTAWRAPQKFGYEYVESDISSKNTEPAYRELAQAVSQLVRYAPPQALAMLSPEARAQLSSDLHASFPHEAEALSGRNSVELRGLPYNQVLDHVSEGSERTHSSRSGQPPPDVVENPAAGANASIPAGEATRGGRRQTTSPDSATDQKVKNGIHQLHVFLLYALGGGTATGLLIATSVLAAHGALWKSAICQLSGESMVCLVLVIHAILELHDARGTVRHALQVVVFLTTVLSTLVLIGGWLLFFLGTSDTMKDVGPMIAGFIDLPFILALGYHCYCKGIGSPAAPECDRCRHAV